ncbi:hypothetical protein X777_07844 [Ooceraea biroi]|uniref:Uncharacterized protein n=1 Tax=Ooceraea biroi TaxID=2015173 RepID=A0A026X0I1_OOCBI|nr:hypothetical protein X777_07844 [Ooceraea biroi]
MYTYTRHTDDSSILDPIPDLDRLSPCESPVSSRKSKAIFLSSLRVRISCRSRYQNDQWYREVGDVVHLLGERRPH